MKNSTIVAGGWMLDALIDKWFIKQPRLRLLVTRLLEKDRTDFVNVIGTTVFANSIKEHGYTRAQRLARRSSLLRDELPSMLNVAAVFSAGDTFVDVGANVGMWCCTMARLRRLHPRTAIWAFEANPDTHSRLVRSVEGLDINVANVAISDSAGELKFVEGAVSHVFTTLENASAATLSGRTPVSVSSRRLDSFAIQGDGIIIKIDVEGQELEVLEGAKEFFDKRRVKAVFIDGYKNAGVLDFLRQYGFRLFDGRSLRAVASDERPYNVLALAG